MRKRTPAVTRFWRNVIVKKADQCWEWRRSGKRYPNFWDGERQIGANRYALQAKLGRELRPGELACHTCDNPRCVNPSHLFVGSDDDNSKDMVAKGRKEVGVDVFGAKLTDAKVLRIRRDYDAGKISIEKVCKKYGVSDGNVSHILHGKTWRHVGGPIQTRYLKTIHPDLKASAQRMLREGIVQAEIARRLGVSASLITKIKKGKS